MKNNIDADITLERTLTIIRFIPASPDKVYRAWTEPELLKKWFAPLPWTTPLAEMDIRPGGASLIVMRSPEGEEFPNPGQYMEVVPNKKLIFTDAYTGAWQPSVKAFMTGELSFEAMDGGTKYTASVHHWSVADREQHEKMGFFEGWGKCTEQLKALVEGM